MMRIVKDFVVFRFFLIRVFVNVQLKISLDMTWLATSLHVRMKTTYTNRAEVVRTVARIMMW